MAVLLSVVAAIATSVGVAYSDAGTVWARVKVKRAAMRHVRVEKDFIFAMVLLVSRYLFEQRYGAKRVCEITLNWM